jgi:hypothetical protein
MENYKKSKNARYITSVVYLLVLGFLVGGTLLSKQGSSDPGQRQTTSAISK